MFVVCCRCVCVCVCVCVPLVFVYHPVYIDVGSFENTPCDILTFSFDPNCINKSTNSFD